MKCLFVHVEHVESELARSEQTTYAYVSLPRVRCNACLAQLASSLLGNCFGSGKAAPASEGAERERERERGIIDIRRGAAWRVSKEGVKRCFRYRPSLAPLSSLCFVRPSFFLKSFSFSSSFLANFVHTTLFRMTVPKRMNERTNERTNGGRCAFCTPH